MSPMPEDAPTYLAQLERHLSALPAAERERIVQEISSHLAERSAVGPETLHAAISGLGEPRLLARSFIDDYVLTGALKRGPSWRILIAILPRVWRSLLALTIGGAGVLLYMFALGFLLVAAAKPLVPQYTGMWVDAHGRLIDFGVMNDATGHDILGWWIIPVSLVFALVTYLVAGRFMRWGGKVLLQPRR